MNFITQLFTGKIGAMVHSQFIRYGPGEYAPKAVVKIKNGASVRIVTSFEYVNDFLELLGEHATKDIMVDGKIFLKKKMVTPFLLSKKKGYFAGEIHEKIAAKKVKEWVEQYGIDGYLLLNVQGEEITLKTKTAPPNPRGKYDEKFCTVTISGSLKDVFLKDVLFDVDGPFKTAEINHTITIIDIIIPKEDEHDMALARIHAKRKGKIRRTIIVDGKETKTEKEFLV